MDWLQLLVILITLGTLFLWNRSEARTDNRRAMDLIEAINKEIKDFHERLCALEEKYKKGDK